MSEVKLKPCPFCGGEAQIQCVPNYGMEGKYYYGLCLKCHAKTQARPAEISAAVDWNTRHECKCNKDDMWTYVCGYRED